MNMNTITQTEREPSFTFSFPMNELDHWDLPKVSTSGLMSRESSLFGLLSREHSREHSIIDNTDMAGPAGNDILASESMDNGAHSLSTEQGHGIAGSPTQPCYDFYPHVHHYGEAAQTMDQPVCHQPAHSATVPGYGSPDGEEPCLKRKACEQAQEFTFSCEQDSKKRRVVTATAGKRGAHVKKRPQMQKDARDGQKHWGIMVVELRNEWNAKQMWEHNGEFSAQVRLCSRLHIKSQHECLLRQLQIAMVEGLIEAGEFSSCESQSFLGWTGFQVVRSRGVEFRRRIEDMFAHRPNDKTLNNAMRRAGLVPERGWAEAWNGTCAFVFRAQTRAQYGARD